jgi:hypothetical protein
MPTVHAPVQLTVEHLVAAVKQLPPDELREFKRQLAKWQPKNGKDTDEEAKLLACIKENSRLPSADQRRFNRLRRKRQAEALTETEAGELQAFWTRVERMNVTRLEAIEKLARRRGTNLKTLMHDLGLLGRYVF